MSELHPDRLSYESIWEIVIKEEISHYQDKYVNCIELIPNIKEEIWQKYVSLNNYCKKYYMNPSIEKLDRHKVAACYMIAIASLKPMRISENIGGQEIPLAINELLAITVGLSIVRAFAVAAIKSNKKIESEIADKLIEKFDKGIYTPKGEMVNHGSYLENYANELNFAISEGKICILSIAHEIYLLEIITRIIN